VYPLAQRWELTGFVKNTSVGVVIEIEGSEEGVDSFSAALPREGPPLMRIASMEQVDIPALEDEGFVILKSEAGENAFTFVPPDICVCDACLAETIDPANRRFEYPFTNCTNCGPRYSIIKDVPYDRAQTTMAEFVLCDACRREYENPADRRFHAQPNACARCGPHLWLVVPAGNGNSGSTAREILEEVARMLRGGRIVAWKGLGGYQLACDARNRTAVAELRRRKRRNEKLFAVMVQNLSAAERLCVEPSTDIGSELGRRKGGHGEDLFAACGYLSGDELYRRAGGNQAGGVSGTDHTQTYCAGLHDSDGRHSTSLATLDSTREL
jgi:hydrogenase maturation protein HypF